MCDHDECNETCLGHKLERALIMTAFVAAFTMEAAEQRATNKVHWRSHTMEKGITLWCRPQVRTQTIEYILAEQKLLN